MKVERKVLNRVEGEVELRLHWKNDRVKDAFISAPSYRGFEKVLVGKPVLDALVITPRVCGICGHAHLMATVKAIESVYLNEGLDLTLSGKALSIRKLTLICEILQNHIRWFYLHLFPDLIKLEPSLRGMYEPLRGRAWKEALRASGLPIKVIALFGGQWPHTSYALPGGVMCDPTDYEVVQARVYLEEFREFLEERTLGMPLDEYLSLQGGNYTEKVGGDVGVFVEVSVKHGIHELGKSYGRFVSGGELEPVFSSGVLPGNSRRRRFELSEVSESEEFCFLSGNRRAYTWSKSARYAGLPHETGPLARQLVSGNRVVKSLFREFGDSALVRVLARIDECARLLNTALELTDDIELSEPSWVKPKVDTGQLRGREVGVVEASRGTLIHELEVEEGRIKSYNIITPTVWNLGPRDAKNLGVAERALIGVDSEVKAEIVLRSFDVCSVCTAH